MGHSEALNGGFSTMFASASLVTSFFLPAEIPVLLLLLTYPLALYAVGLMIGNSHGQYNSAFTYFGILMALTILIFAIIYWRYGLISNGKHVDISIMEAFYFSVTTWTTLGYGDFSPIPRIKHISSIQAILGYIGLGLWVALMNGFIGNLSQMRQEINEHNRKLFKKIDNEKEDS